MVYAPPKPASWRTLANAKTLRLSLDATPTSPLRPLSTDNLLLLPFHDEHQGFVTTEDHERYASTEEAL